ncbi:MAG: hypothetical protein KF906_11480 [Actinobacteria bacterium]|nr:hypothetical protein [Actinomycetota bacterium]
MSKGDELVEDARAAFARGRWSAARSAFVDADADQPLGADDLEQLAWSCCWIGDAAGFLNALERAELAFSGAGVRAGAARMALEQARHHVTMLDGVVALTCYVRATEHLSDAPECAEHAQALWSLSFTLMAGGEFAEARAALLEARSIARRVGSPGTEAMAVQGLAHLEVSTGEVGDVLALVDEAAALAMRPGVPPVDAGFVYCAVIAICRALGDWGRATEWTKVATRYCERESIAGYTGLCRFHQGEIDRLHGQLADAEQRVVDVCEELLRINRYSAGWGYSELVEIRVRRGDLDGAEDALAQAVALGDDGQPGRGRLLLARGDAAAAARSLNRSLADPATSRRSGGSSCSRCTSRPAWRWATSRRRPRLWPSSRTSPSASAPTGRLRRRRSLGAGSRSIGAMWRLRSSRCGMAFASGVSSRPRTKLLRRGCCSRRR